MFNEKIICKRYSWKKKGNFLLIFFETLWRIKHPTCEKTFLFQTDGLLLQQILDKRCVPQLLNFFKIKFVTVEPCFLNDKYSAKKC